MYLCSPGFEATLVEELSGRGRGAVLGAGFVVVRHARDLVDPAFARQVLLDASLVDGVGPSELADAVLRSLGDEERALLEGRAELQVFSPDFLRRGSARPEPHPLSSGVARLDEILRAKVEGRAKKRGVERSEGARELRVQVLMIEGWKAWVSSSPVPVVEAPLSAWPSTFSKGAAPVVGYENAPSSAFRKLVEALSWLASRPEGHDVVLDLGAAPGGWSYVALESGARVIAYDRADLDPHLSAHPRLTHVRQDAFSNAPLEEATWLLCDVIDVPERSLGLIEQALAVRTLRRIVVTIKLKPPISLEPVAKAQHLARQAEREGWRCRVKHLVHNKHEVTFMAARA